MKCSDCSEEEEKLSVAVVQVVPAFLDAELADFRTMTGTSNMAETPDQNEG